MKTITANQRAAIETPGNVLVLAGAGSGKTSTLVERCLYHILHPVQPVSVTRMLIVTFTDAAAAEIRRRLSERLETARASADVSTAARLDEQIALIESAAISTLHSFCLSLLRQHFHEVGLDPSVMVLREDQSALFIENVLNAIIERHTGAATKDAERVRQLIEEYANGDEEVRALVLRLHNYTQTLADPARWFSEQLAALQEDSPLAWRVWLTEAMIDWCDRWGTALEPLADNRFAIQFCARVKAARAGNPGDFAALFADVVNAIDPVPWGFAPHRDEIQQFFDEAAFFQSLLQKSDGSDPLTEDWEWVRGPMETLLRLTQEFSDEYGRVKREHASVDFHDLEQFALDLLTGKGRAARTNVALDCRRMFDLVFVDEYQDINAAQDAILRAVAREGGLANRFLVGDLKQSIYRFRLADPAIFQSYNARWREPNADGKVIPLADNFRSAPPILDFVNALFGTLMRRELGGVDYDLEAQLRPGISDRPRPLEPCVALHLRVTEKEESRVDDEEPDENVTEIEREARAVASVLRELRDGSHLVWDAGERKMRPAAWADMVVLLRSPRGRAEMFLKEFASAGIPLIAPRGGFYDSTEIADLLSLLQLLDNPLQDVPLLAVLRSPLVGLSLDELAAVRSRQPTGLFWNALTAWHRTRPTATLEDYSIWTKVDQFLRRFDRWRKMGRQTALSERIERMLRETQYVEWLLTQSRPAQRQANVHRFIELAGQFDPMQRQGLQRFLRFVQAQRDAETAAEPDAVEGGNAVRLMSIHQSKGLEFSVVALAGLGVEFNSRDFREHVLLDEKYGLCAHVKPPGFGSSYPSLPWWLAQNRQSREMLGEELRLLYVALTRARDTLLLFGSSSQKSAAQWSETEPDPSAIEAVRHPLMWLGPWCAQHAGAGWHTVPEGSTALFRWRIHRDGQIGTTPCAIQPETPATDPVRVAQLAERLEWRYPWAALAGESAKLSVTALRETNEEAEGRFQRLFPFRSRRAPAKLSAADVGTAHHIFLQSIDLQTAHVLEALRKQAAAFVEQQVLSPEQAQMLDLCSVAAFWDSPAGREIRAHINAVHREIPFTARFARSDLLEAGVDAALPEGEYLIVQGTIDLAVILPGEVWILDFKTDGITEGELQQTAAIYAPQLRFYGSAVGRIYNRAVTKRWLHFLTLSRTLTV